MYSVYWVNSSVFPVAGSLTPGSGNKCKICTRERIRASNKGSNQAGDDDLDVDRLSSLSFSRYVDHTRKNLELGWRYQQSKGVSKKNKHQQESSPTRQEKDDGVASVRASEEYSGIRNCNSCSATGYLECKFCKGTGFLMVGDALISSVNTQTSKCPCCKGRGEQSCRHCCGTGRIAAWLP
mmetsp:Transcript_1773/g.3177  ORF Transcript_1773/g.3177 Transcript_1773/m.3177 type:complete len:181 (+) Transcript_1773:78-620(+)